MGHEFTGEVAAVGDGVEAWRVGDRAVSMPVFACGACRACAAGRPLDCRGAGFIGLGGAPGGYAEYVAVPGSLSFRVPDAVPDAVATLVEPLAVALHAVRLGLLCRDDAVLVVGAGPVGLAIALLCRHFGAAHVLVSDLVPERAARAMALGADGWIDAGRDDVRAAMRARCGRAPSLVFDAAGGAQGVQRCIDLAGAGGRIVVVAMHAAPSPVATMSAFLKELTLVFAKAYTVLEFREALGLLASGAVDPAPMVTRTVGFADFPAAFGALATGGGGKLLLDPTA